MLERGGLFGRRVFATRGIMWEFVALVTAAAVTLVGLVLWVRWMTQVGWLADLLVWLGSWETR